MYKGVNLTITILAQQEARQWAKTKMCVVGHIATWLQHF
jgi:hypothetical protein